MRRFEKLAVVGAAVAAAASWLDARCGTARRLHDAFTGRVGPYRDDVDVRSEEPSPPDLDIWRLDR